MVDIMDIYNSLNLTIVTVMKNPEMWEDQFRGNCGDRRICKNSAFPPKGNIHLPL